MTTPSTPPVQAALDAELEQIAELDRVIRAAQAEQFRRVETARSLAAAAEGVTDASPPADREFATRAFVAELATALVIHEATAGRLVADAARLTGSFSATLGALAAGSICVGRARSLLEVAGTLPAGSLTVFEIAALERAHCETPPAFRRRIRRLRERLHPEPLADRGLRAAEERRVCFEPAEDGMAWLTLHLEAERGVAIMARLDALAGARHTTDHRTRAQLTVDVAADLLLGCAADAERAGGSPLGVVRPRVYVTVPVLSLLGHTDEPAELDGYGPIDADTARRLAAHAPSFRRILTHPETGAYLSYGRTAYRVPADLAGYLRVRDGNCRFPGCSRRAAGCDIDHTIDWSPAGRTDHDNLAHACPKHHRLKHHTRWQMTQEPGGVIRWTSPAGREHRTAPEHPFRATVTGEPHPGFGPGEPDPPWAAKRSASDHDAAA